MDAAQALVEFLGQQIFALFFRLDRGLEAAVAFLLLAPELLVGAVQIHAAAGGGGLVMKDQSGFGVNPELGAAVGAADFKDIAHGNDYRRRG